MRLWRILFVFVLGLAASEFICRSLDLHKKLNPFLRRQVNIEFARTRFKTNAFPLKPQKVSLSPFMGIPITYEINEFGFRRTLAPKAAKTRKVIIYGGSFVFDLLADQNKDWISHAQKFLNEKNSDFELINAGMPGAMTYDNLVRMAYIDIPLKPELLVHVGTWNDLRYFTSGSDFFLQQEGPKDIINPFLEYYNSLDYVLGENSALYLLLRTASLYAAYRFPKVQQIAELNKKQNFLANEQIDDLSAGLKVYEKNISLIAEIAKSSIGKVLFMNEPSMACDPKNEEEKNRAEVTLGFQMLNLPMSYAMFVKTIDDANKVVKKVATEKNLLFIDAISKFSCKKDLFVDAAHFSAEGSKQFGEFFARSLLQLKLNK